VGLYLGYTSQDRGVIPWDIPLRTVGLYPGLYLSEPWVYTRVYLSGGYTLGVLTPQVGIA